MSKKSDSSRMRLSILLAATLLLASALLTREAELRLALPLLVGVTATMTMILACALYFGERNRIAWSAPVILTVALLLRLMFLFHPPQLSDDIYRYLWDGSNLLRGNNPYAAAPAAIHPPHALAAVHPRINHPEFVTIYPPAAQAIFAGGAALGGTISGLKTFLMLLDMGLCALLVMLLRRLGMPVWRAALYAWNPLPVLEIAGSGHVDGAGLAMLIGAICLLVIHVPLSQNPIPTPALPLKGRERKRLLPLQGGGWEGDGGMGRWPFLLSGALLAAAGLVKLFPFVLAPLLFLLVPAGRRRYFSAGFVASLALLIVPFLPQLANMFTTLDSYARNWEFAGFAFTVLRSLTGSGTAARLILSAAFLLAGAVILIRCATAIRRSASPANSVHQALQGCYAIAMALLLLTPTLQPWYALCLAVFLPFCAGPAGLLLCWVPFLTYRVQIPYFILGQWIESPWVTAAVFLAPVTTWLLCKLIGGCSHSSGACNVAE